MSGWRHWPFAAKLSIAAALLIALVIGFLTAETLRRERQEVEDHARLMLDGLAAGASDALSSQDSSALAALTQRYAAIPTVLSVRLYDAAGQAIGQAGNGGNSGSQGDSLGPQLIARSTPLLEWSSEQLLAGQAVVVDGRRVGAVALALSTASLKAEATATWIRGIVALAVAAVAGTLFMVLLSRSLTVPLRETARAAQGLARGDFSESIPVYNGAELAALGRALNDMTLELQRAVAHKGSILEAMFEGVIIADKDGRVVEFNPAARRMFGYESSQLSGRRVSALFDRDSFRRKPSRNITSYLQEGEGSLFDRLIEATAIRADGTEFSVEWAITPLSPQEPANYTIVVHDISARKRVEDELRRAKVAAEAASRAKSTFLANMTHEVRTPLTSILGYSELLQEECSERGYTELAPDLKRISTAGQHLLDLISSILDLAKIEAGKMDLYLETFSLASLLEDVATVSRPLAARNGNSLKIDHPPDIGTMHADRLKVHQVLLNLLSNAAKFTQRGRITLRASRQLLDGVEWVQFEVSDTGIGMTEQQVQLLFQAFTQTESSIAYEYGGSGLGLAISQRFCQLMGGRIVVQSKLGEGSTFTVHLPAVVSAGTQETDEDSDE